MENKLKAIEIIEPIMNFFRNVIKKYFILSKNPHPLAFAQILNCLNSVNIQKVYGIFQETPHQNVENAL